jgi:transglutaminase-like putative cysteine protease
MNAAAVRLQWVAQGLLGVGLLGLQPALLLSWLVFGLTLLAALKLLEARRLGERRLVALLQLVCAGLLGALQPDLAPSLLQLLAVLVALAGLLALETGEGPNWSLLLRRSLQVVAAALPMALALFLLLPRLEPFAALPGLGGGGAVTGLNPDLAPGSIASLVASDAAAARVVFGAGGPPAEPQRYWRVLVHEGFDGERWTSRAAAPTGAPDQDPAGDPAAAGASAASPGRDQATPAETLAADPAATGGTPTGGDAAPEPGGATELWLIEASGLTPVPWGGSGQPLGAELRVNRRGELRHKGSPAQRRMYLLRQAGAPGLNATSWQRQPPTMLDLVLPRGANPRLEALAAGWSRQPTAALRLAAAETWFRTQPFRYTRQPGSLPSRAPLDAFLFERRQGFCGHYASAFSALMRAAGVPARVVSGYQGGDWVQPLSGPAYLDIRQNDAHAWSEVWLEGEGWRRVDPTAWLPGAAAAAPATGRIGPALWLVRQWWGLDLAWGRWWMGFDRSRQEALLNRLLGGHPELVGVLVVGAVALGLGGGLAGLNWVRHRPRGDGPRRELERSLRSLARHGLEPDRGETLRQWCGRLEMQDPALANALRAFAEPYERWRHGAGARDRRSARQQAAALRIQRRRLEQLLRRQPARQPARRPAP